MLAASSDSSGHDDKDDDCMLSGRFVAFSLPTGRENARASRGRLLRAMAARAAVSRCTAAVLAALEFKHGRCTSPRGRRDAASGRLVVPLSGAAELRALSLVEGSQSFSSSELSDADSESAEGARSSSSADSVAEDVALELEPVRSSSAVVSVSKSEGKHSSGSAGGGGGAFIADANTFSD